MSQTTSEHGHDFELSFAVLRPLVIRSSRELYSAELAAELKAKAGVLDTRVNMRTVRVRVNGGLTFETFRGLRIIGSTPPHVDALATVDDVVAAVRWATGDMVVLLRSSLVIRVAESNPLPPPGCRVPAAEEPVRRLRW